MRLLNNNQITILFSWILRELGIPALISSDKQEMEFYLNTVLYDSYILKSFWSLGKKKRQNK